MLPGQVATCCSDKTRVVHTKGRRSRNQKGNGAFVSTISGDTATKKPSGDQIEVAQLNWEFGIAMHGKAKEDLHVESESRGQSFLEDLRFPRSSLEMVEVHDDLCEWTPEVTIWRRIQYKFSPA